MKITNYLFARKGINLHSFGYIIPINKLKDGKYMCLAGNNYDHLPMRIELSAEQISRDYDYSTHSKHGS